MIQLSFKVEAAPGTLPTVSGPLRLTALAAGQRLSGVWEQASLAEARAAVGRYLAEMPGDLEVTNLFTGVSAPAALMAQRLMSAPTVANSFAIRHAPVGDRICVRLLGMYQLAKPDLIIAVEPDVELSGAYELASRLAAWKLAPDAALLPPDRPMPYGFWLLGMGEASLGEPDFWAELKRGLDTGFLKGAFDERMATPAPRFVLEADDVLAPEPERWLIGASRAIRTATAQRASAIACGISAPRLDAPSAHDACVICSRIDDSEGFFAYREAPRSELDSGWRFACLDPDHPHDRQTTRLTRLSHVPSRQPGIVRYLALPVGWVVSYEDGGYWLRAPGEAGSYLDERAATLSAPWEPSRA